MLHLLLLMAVLRQAHTDKMYHCVFIVRLQCQATDTGAPKTPYIIPVYFTAGKICDNSGCVGGDYTVKNVQDQMAYLNTMYARTGIQFTWDGVINTANANSMSDIQADTWVCGLKRYGDKPYKQQPTIHVITAPEHL